MSTAETTHSAVRDEAREWEYRIFKPRISDSWAKIERQLNEYGNARWELVECSALGFNVFVFKRQKMSA